MGRPRKKIIDLYCEDCNEKLVYSSRKSHLNAMKKEVNFCRSCARKNSDYKHFHTESHKKYMSNLMKGRKITWSEKIKKNHWSNDVKKKKRKL